jgi:hypothetical protein
MKLIPPRAIALVGTRLDETTYGRGAFISEMVNAPPSPSTDSTYAMGRSRR